MDGPPPGPVGGLGKRWGFDDNLAGAFFGRVQGNTTIDDFERSEMIGYTLMDNWIIDEG